MDDASTSSILSTPIRVCPEHLCKLFNERQIWERAQAGEFQYRIERKLKSLPFEDHHGNICSHTELLTVWDQRFPQEDFRRDVAFGVNRHTTSKGSVGGSGKWDPSKVELQIDGRRYRRFKTKGREAFCELCEAGDMIPEQARFFDSTYRPKV